MPFEPYVPAGTPGQAPAAPQGGLGASQAPTSGFQPLTASQAGLLSATKGMSLPPAAPAPGIFSRLADFGNNVQGTLQKAAHYTGLPQASSYVMDTFGNMIGRGVGTVLGAGQAMLQGKGAGDVLKAAGAEGEARAKDTGTFGGAIGEAAPLAAAETMWGGKILNALIAAPSIYKGIQQLRNAPGSSPDIFGTLLPDTTAGRDIAGGTNLGLGVLALYGASKSEGYLPGQVDAKVVSAIDKMRAGNVPPGVQTEIAPIGGQAPAFAGPGAASAQENFDMTKVSDDLDTYLKAGEDAVKDYSKPTPLDMAGEKAGDALTSLKQGLKDFGSIKSAIVDQNAGKYVTGLDTVRQNFEANISDRLGLVIDEDGQVVAGPDGAKIGESDIPAVQKMYDEISAFNKRSTVGKIDNTVDRLQSEVYGDAKKNVMFQPNDKVDSVLKATIGDLNGALKDSLGDDFTSMNAYYSEIKDVFDNLNKALGDEGSKGGSLMKRIFSPTDGGTKALFGQVEALTGVDLVKEATLAKFAMEATGDVRQANLLEQLSIKDAANPLSLTAKAAKFIFDKFAKDAMNPAKAAQDIASGKLPTTK